MWRWKDNRRKKNERPKGFRDKRVKKIGKKEGWKRHVQRMKKLRERRKEKLMKKKECEEWVGKKGEELIKEKKESKKGEKE